jgi:hypothetical protein
VALCYGALLAPIASLLHHRINTDKAVFGVCLAIHLRFDTQKILSRLK